MCGKALLGALVTDRMADPDEHPGSQQEPSGNAASDLYKQTLERFQAERNQ
jgi:hypothetical protein